MKIYFCIAGGENVDPTISRCGREIEVGQVPQIDETIKLKLNLFDYIFANVYSEYKNDIIFDNHATEGIVVDVIHSFHVVTREKPRMFHGQKSKPELCSAIRAEEDVEVIQSVFVVVKFRNQRG